jgi:ectoine hydroxylase-related dioxygenase (phytanoyl-CoA dioxygenase family)
MVDCLKSYYDKQGFVTGVPIISATEALTHRSILEAVEAERGPMHYQFKVHTVMNSPYKLATLPHLLDIVEQLIGPDILLYSAAYIVKEAHSESHVSWHQDLTYWGLDSDAQVSVWLALSDASEDSGCMHMIAGSHKRGQQKHHNTQDANNVLLSGQTIADIDTHQSVVTSLKAGEASFHHGWTVHCSKPNVSDDRRIGLNIQYISPAVKQIKLQQDSAILVRGVDNYGHFQTDQPATSNFDVEAWQNQQNLDAKLKGIQGNTTTQTSIERNRTGA